MQNHPAAHQHAIVFVDHHESRVLFPDGAQPDGAHVVAHRLDKTKDGHRHAMDRRDLDTIAANLRGIEEILIAGPSTAKLELHQFLKEHHADVAGHVVDVVALEHLTLGEIKEFARAQFKLVDVWR